MNFNTFVKIYGLNPDDFKPNIIEPVEIEGGNMLLLDQNTDKVPCPFCSSENITIKGYYEKDINCSDNLIIKTFIRVKMVRFKCRDCSKTYNKKLQGLEKYNILSNQVIKQISAEFNYCKTFDEIASLHHITKAKVINIFDQYVADQPRKKLPQILCIDEFYFTSRKEGKYCVVLIDWETKEVIDIIENRRMEYLVDYFNKIDQSERNNVKYFVSDLFDTYRSIRQRFFPKAHHIADFFHITIQLTRAVNMVRPQVMKQLDTTTIEYKFMKKHWKLFLQKSNCIPQTKTFKTKKGFEHPIYDLFYKCLKLNDNFLLAYDCLQDLFKFKRDNTFTDAVEHVSWLSNKLKNSTTQILIDVANTYDKWQIEIGNAFTLHQGFKNISNGIAEATNNEIKTVIKAAYGYKNFIRFRKRTLILLRNKK